MSSLEVLKLPKTVPVTTTRFRPPKKNIPQTKLERDHLRSRIHDFLHREKLVPPMPLTELEVHARALLSEMDWDDRYLHYTAVSLNNEMWCDTLATIPYERRLLLMPKCLRVEDKCPAPFDEFGLLCKQCGLCTIQDFQNEAERLGYAVLVAEGSAVVMSLIQTGKIEAIVGISCLPVLERTFPYVEAAAIPAIAVPLLQDDCIDTTVDIDYVWDYLHLTSEDQTRRLNLNALHDEVREWFAPATIDAIMGPAKGKQEAIAREWLARAGKRWRPFLLVAAYQALRDETAPAITDDLKRLALAVECFHKASLIHDDIEDEDEGRYEQPTLHTQESLPVALNAGDLLIGEGYRLIGECQIADAQKIEMLLAAANGQRELCRGQGAELLWTQNPTPLKPPEVLEIFRQKTAPAFEVALKLGASCAGRLAEVESVITHYSQNLGIAYQIRDDMDDLAADAGDNGLEKMRPSVLLAVARDKAKGDDKAMLEALWNHQDLEGLAPHKIRELVHAVKADDQCLLLLETYKEEATRALQDLENANLKGLLRRVIGKIFNDLVIKGWCHTFEEQNGVGQERATAG